MIKNVLITGSNGQLGRSLAKHSNDYKAFNFIFTDIEELDITAAGAIRKFVEDNNINAIINCAAYTAVDKAEQEILKAHQINNTAAEALAKAAKKNDIVLLHVSTDYVFDGKSHLPYTEDMAVNPPSVYGKSKLAGEQAVLKTKCKGAIVRTSWLYSEFGHNFLKTILHHGSQKPELKVVFDQIGTPTYANDLAIALIKMLEKADRMEDKCEVYHFSNEGVASWYDFAIAIKELASLGCNILAVDTSQYPLPAPRPAYSVLDKAKIKSNFNLQIPYWRDSLKECFEHLKNAKKIIR